MQLRYILPRSQYQAGDVVEVPDGAAYDPLALEEVPAGGPAPVTVPATAAPVVAPAPAAEPEEM